MEGANHRKLFIHTTAWVIYFSFSFILFSQKFSILYASISTMVIVGLHLILFYANYGYLISKFYLKRKRVAYFLSVFASLLLTIFIWWNFSSTFLPMDKLGFPPGFQRPPNFSIAQMSIACTIPIGFTSIVVLLVSSFLRVSEHARIKEIESDILKAENKDAELKFLKSQVNPHFLFNVLNNIYSLSITKPDKTPETLLKLSNMLRYLLYECHEDKVPLNKEIDYIQNYIELQKLKDEGMNNITFNFTKSDLSITPMLLIPFIENAFKHSRIEDLKNGWIQIDISCTKNGILEFTAKNSLLIGPHEKDETSGIGINNVKNRLELLYPSKYEMELKQDTKNNAFVVNLKMILN